jgi:hypothetical protein
MLFASSSPNLLPNTPTDVPEMSAKRTHFLVHNICWNLARDCKHCNLALFFDQQILKNFHQNMV